MTHEILAHYEQLAQVADRFRAQADVVEQLQHTIEAHMQQLERGWTGRGADAFFAELQGDVLPGTRRLQAALDVGAVHLAAQGGDEGRGKDLGRQFR